jgi:hypothetical protein
VKGHLQIYHAFIHDPNGPDDDDEAEDEVADGVAPGAATADAGG